MLRSFLRALRRADDAARDYDRECLVDAKRDHFETLNRILSEYNAAKITGAFDPLLLQRVLAAAAGIYEGRKAAIESGAVPDQAKRNYTRRTIPFQELIPEGIDTTNFPVPTLITDAARAYLGKEPQQTVSSVRAIVPGPSDQRLPFHQDETILQSRLLNIWIPLTPCGIHAPSLEVVITGERKLLDVVGSKDDEIPVERARLDDDLVRATFGASAFWHPVMNPGDALVFTGTTAHRSFVRPEMSETRVSIELRLA